MGRLPAELCSRPQAPRGLHAGTARSIPGRPGGRRACRRGGDIVHRARARALQCPNTQSHAGANSTFPTIVFAFSCLRAYLRGSVKFWGRVKNFFRSLAGRPPWPRNGPAGRCIGLSRGAAPAAPRVKARLSPAKASLLLPPRRSNPYDNPPLRRASICEPRAPSRIQEQTGREAVNRERLWRIDNCSGKKLRGMAQARVHGLGTTSGCRVSWQGLWRSRGRGGATPCRGCNTSENTRKRDGESAVGGTGCPPV